MLFFDWNFHTPQNLSSYMAVPFLDAVTDFCDDTEERFHDQGILFSFLSTCNKIKESVAILLIFRIAYKA